MADQEQVERLLAGVEGWNEWVRSEDPEIDLREADLRGANLCKAELREARMQKADLRGANLRGAELFRGSLSMTKLRVANLRGAGLNEADLKLADLSGADLRDARLNFADLSTSGLVGSNLEGASVQWADLRHARLDGANFANVNFGWGIVSSDWAKAKGLGQIKHAGPSFGGLEAAHFSRDSLPEGFLRGCGLQDWEIWMAKLYVPDLTEADVGTILEHVAHLKGIQAIHPRGVVISYSRKDSVFVDRLAAALDVSGVRYWRDTNHMVAGPMGPQIDQAIVLHRTVLLVLSENAIQSDWVYSEVKRARKLEQDSHVDYALLPLTLDDAWKESDWSTPIRDWFEDKYNIVRFTEEDDFDISFQKLLDGLRKFYQEREGTTT